jgi:hypothetical protein
MRISRYAIIPSNGRACLDRCLGAIRPQVDITILIKTKEFTRHGFHHDPGLLAYQDYSDINISRWWNQGLDYADTHSSLNFDSAKYDVAIINDDVIVPEGWFDAVSGTMRQMGVAAGCSGGTGGMPVLNTQPVAVPLHTRMQGFAFIVAGELGVRADETLKWYFTDDHVDWKSRELGGVVMIPGMHVEHLYPNGQLTPELLAQTAVDAQTFVDIWGRRPW